MEDQLQEDAQQARMMDQIQEDAQQGVLQEGLQGGQQEGQQEGQQGGEQGGGQRVTRRRVTTRRASRLTNDSARPISEQPLPHMDYTAVPSQPLPRGEATASAQAQADQPILRTTAIDEAATAAAVAPASRVQLWEDDSLLARMASAAQGSMLQSLVRSDTASMEEDSIVGQEAGVQLGQVGGAKLCRKRSVVEDCVQPAAKRRRQLPAAVEGSLTMRNTLSGMASAAAADMLVGGRKSMEAAQGEDGVAEGVMPSPFDLVLNTVAKGQQNMRKYDWEHV